MKKTYMTPETVVVKIQPMQVLAASQLGMGDDGNASEAEVASYRNSLWGD